jgi:hypothetical protein
VDSWFLLGCEEVILAADRLGCLSQIKFSAYFFGSLFFDLDQQIGELRVFMGRQRGGWA